MPLRTFRYHTNICRLKDGVLVSSRFCRKYCSNQSVEEVQYPPILDTSFRAKKVRQKKSWHDKIRAFPTVEEKLIALNMPRYYGWRCISLNEGVIPYNSLSFIQTICRTHFIETGGIYTEDSNQEFDSYSSDLSDKLKPLVNDLLLFCHQYKSPSLEDEKSKSESFTVNQLNSLLVSNLSRDAPHLMQAHIDHDPRVEAFWVAGGMEPTYVIKKAKKNSKWQKEYADDPEDRNIQYVGHPILQLRHADPLPPVIKFSECENPDFTVPSFQYDPRVLGLTVERRHVTSIPGFWPGDPCEYSLMSFHGREFLKDRPEVYGQDEHVEALHCQAILASYGWLLPIACYQGFSTFNDVTYPLVTQTVFTDGQLWSFYTYQLNTTIVHSDNTTVNPRRNICWGTPTMKLFEKIEDGKVIGFNDNTFKMLLKMYLNKPQKVEFETKPYLSEHRYVANIPEDEKRIWLESRFKHLFSLRPRCRLAPEVYHWEKIYKIDHKTRPMEPRRRPFELGIDPLKRELDDHAPEYIPKAKRPVMASKYAMKKNKWAKTYYPK